MNQLAVSVSTSKSRVHPERMRRASRPAEQFDDPSEKLYQRCRIEDFPPINLSFSFPAQSVNRSRFSEPSDVRVSEDGRYDRWGVISYRCQDLPTPLKNDQGVLFHFFPQHIPEENNYAHSEIRHAPNPPSRPSPKVRKEFRARLSQAVKTEIKPRGG